MLIIASSDTSAKCSLFGDSSVITQCPSMEGYAGETRPQSPPEIAGASSTRVCRVLVTGMR